MASTLLPEELSLFLQRQVDSIIHLEALLLLFRNAHTAFDGAAVAQHRYIDKPAASQALLRLQERGLIAGDNAGFRYSPTADTDPLVRALDQYYAQHLIAITALIHAKSASRIQEFAKAFKLRRTEKGEK